MSIERSIEYKDPYIFDFISMTEDMNKRDIEIY